MQTAYSTPPALAQQWRRELEERCLDRGLPSLGVPGRDRHGSPPTLEQKAVEMTFIQQSSCSFNNAYLFLIIKINVLIANIKKNFKSHL